MKELTLKLRGCPLFNGIDEKNLELTINCIKEFTQYKTVILITHNPEEARLFGAKKVEINNWQYVIFII